MLGLGFGFSILAASDGFKMDDPYPGYGRVERQRNQILEDYADSKAELIEELGDIKDNAAEDMKKAKDDVANRRTECYSIASSRDRMEVHFQDHLNHLEKCANDLLTTYREENKENRSTPAPNHFSEKWTLPHPTSPRRDQGSDVTKELVENAFRHSITSYTSRTKEVFDEYEQSIKKYEQIEQLTHENFSYG